MTYHKSNPYINFTLALAGAAYVGYKVKKAGKDNKTVVMFTIGFFIAAMVTFYLLDLAFKKISSAEESGFSTCRPGTCPYTRTDGSVFCTAAACKQAKSSIM